MCMYIYKSANRAKARTDPERLLLHSCRASSQPVLLCASCDQCPPPAAGPRFPMLITNGQRFPMLITNGPRFLCYSLLWYFPLSICCSASRDSVCCCVLVFQFAVAFSSFNLQWRFSCFILLLRFRVSVCRGVFLISVCCGAFVLQFAVAFSCFSLLLRFPCFSLLLRFPLSICCGACRVSVCCCVSRVSVCCGAVPLSVCCGAFRVSTRARPAEPQDPRMLRDELSISFSLRACMCVSC